MINDDYYCYHDTYYFQAGFGAKASNMVADLLEYTGVSWRYSMNYFLKIEWTPCMKLGRVVL